MASLSRLLAWITASGLLLLFWVQTCHNASDAPLLDQTFEHYYINSDITCKTLDVLGQGGTSRVYLAVCRSISQGDSARVAIKQPLTLANATDRRNLCMSIAKLGILTQAFQDSRHGHTTLVTCSRPWVDCVPDEAFIHSLGLPIAFVQPMRSGIDVRQHSRTPSGFNITGVAEETTQLCDDPKVVFSMPYSAFAVEQTVLSSLMYVQTSMDPKSFDMNATLLVDLYIPPGLILYVRLNGNTTQFYLPPVEPSVVHTDLTESSDDKARLLPPPPNIVKSLELVSREGQLPFDNGMLPELPSNYSLPLSPYFRPFARALFSQFALAKLEPTDPLTVCALGHAIFSALAAAHSKGLTHGDIKPANIVIACQNSTQFDVHNWRDQHASNCPSNQKSNLYAVSKPTLGESSAAPSLSSSSSASSFADFSPDDATTEEFAISWRRQTETLTCLRNWQPFPIDCIEPNTLADPDDCNWTPSIVARFIDLDSAILCPNPSDSKGGGCPLSPLHLQSTHITEEYAAPELRMTPIANLVWLFEKGLSGLDVYAAAQSLLEFLLGTPDVFRLSQTEVRALRKRNLRSSYHVRGANRPLCDIAFINWHHASSKQAQDETLGEWFEYCAKFRKSTKVPTSSEELDFIKELELREAMEILAHMDPKLLQSRLADLYPYAPVFRELPTDLKHTGISTTMLQILQRALEPDPNKRAKASQLSRAFATCNV